MNSMDVLLARLAWPSALVRERATVAIAELMSQEGAVGEQTRNALMTWIGQQNLESVAALGIIVLCRFADRNPERIAELGDLDRILRKPSLLSYELLRHLTGGTAAQPDWSQCHSDPATTTFEPPDFFGRFRTNFLPLIYSMVMQEVQDRTMLPMFRQWAFEWAQIVYVGGYKPSERVFDFGMRPHGSKMMVDFPVSEIYRSAYLRSLAWALTSGKLTIETAISLAHEACPIDLGLWRVQPGIKPGWWPTPRLPGGTIDTVPAQVWAALSMIWETRHKVFKEKMLLAASGPVLHGPSVYDLSVRAVFQAANGPVPGEPEEIMEASDEAQGNHSSHGLPFGGSIDPIDPTTISLISHDWSILPASIFVRPRTFPRWQYWRGFRGVQLPAPFLATGGLSFRCELDAVKVFDGVTEIGSWQDWTDGIAEEFDDGVPFPHGWALEVSCDLVDEFARRSRSTLAWICELKVYHRDHSHQPYQKFSIHQLYGTTNIVLPR